MTLGETAPVVLIVQLRTTDGASTTLCASVSPAEEGIGIASDAAVLLVQLWRESPNVIRGSIRHPKSGCTALVQGNDALWRLAGEVRLRFTEAEGGAAESV
jgi:hypothetical protein